MSSEKDLFHFSLWNIDTYGYLPVFTRSEKKIFSQQELQSHEIVSSENPIDKLIESAKDRCNTLKECHQKALAAIEDKKRKERESNPHVSMLPKTPNPTKRTIKKSRPVKRRSSIQAVRKSTRIMGSLKKIPDASRKSQLILDSLPEFNMSASSEEAEDYAETNNMSHENAISKESPIPHAKSISPRNSVSNEPCSSGEKALHVIDEDLAANQISSETDQVNQEEEMKLSLETSNEEEPAHAASSSLELEVKQSSKKTGGRKKKKTKESRQSMKRSTRSRTRHAVRLSAERKSTAVWSDVSPRDSLESNSETKAKKRKASPKVVEEETVKATDQSPAITTSNVHKISAEAERADGRRLSIPVRRLTSDEIKTMVENQKIPTTVEQTVEKDEDVQLVLSDCSDEFEQEKAAPSRKKSRTQKRKSQARLRSLAKKRRTLQDSAEVNTPEKLSSAEKVPDESPSTIFSKATVTKNTRTRPRIVKPVIRKKDVKAKADRSVRTSARKKGRTPLHMSSNATPVRTRFMSPMLRTPTSAKLHNTIKSFLSTNTPDTANKDALIEAKMKILEEKQRQGEERQKKMEEEKKQKLEESKKKREERILRAIQTRKMKEKLEKERQDELQGKWAQRIEDAKRTKTQQKKEKTAKITKELEKIAKAGAKRKEEEEEKLKRLKEQNEEREKRLQLQQEQKIREKQWEDHKKAEEEKAKERDRLAQLEEEERAKRAETAALKKKQELEEKNRKHQERMEKMRKNAELKREAQRKQRIEEKRLVKEKEEQRKLEEKLAKKEKLRLEREETEKRRMQLEKEREMQRSEEARRNEERARELQMQEAKKKEILLREKMKQEELAKQKREKELENLRKLEAAEERIRELHASHKEHLKPLQPTVVVNKAAVDKTFTLNSTFSKPQDESMNNYDMTPRGPDKILLPSTETNYNIDDFCSDDSTDDEDRPKKEVPKWAKGSLLHQAMVKQCSEPPDIDRIFPSLLNPVYLPSLFNRRKERYFKRTSSAQWNSPIMPPGHISFTQQCKGF